MSHASPKHDGFAAEWVKVVKLTWGPVTCFTQGEGAGGVGGYALRGHPGTGGRDRRRSVAEGGLRAAPQLRRDKDVAVCSAWPELYRLLEAGLLDPKIAKTYPLEGASQAHIDVIEHPGGAAGNLVIVP